MTKNITLNPTLDLLATEAGIECITDALFCVPLRYESRAINLSESVVKKFHVPCVFTGTISSHPEQISINPPFFCISAKGKGKLHNDVQLIGSSVLDKNNKISSWKPGTEFSVCGVAKNEKYIFGVVPCESEKPFAVYKGRSRGVSSILPRLINESLGFYLDQAIDRIKTQFDSAKEKPFIIEFLNLNIDKPYKFTSLKQFFYALHYPESISQGEAARLAAGNLAATDCCFRAMHASKRDILLESIIDIPRELVSKLIDRVPFKITNEQRSAMREIWNDLKSNTPMYRLLSGDVGTGKTVVYAVLAAACQKIGKKVVIFAPYSTLVHQVFNEIHQWFPEIPIFRITSDEKQDLKILNSNPILIGTHAVLNWGKSQNYFPDLMVVDEQQKISRSQRETLMAKHTNFLEATATCIPRTFALLIYGGMKVSTIREQPVKKDIKTSILFDDQKTVVFSHIRKEIAANGKVAVILPLVRTKNDSNTEEIDIAADKLAVETALKHWENSFPGKVVGLHGKMAESEKVSKLKEINENKQISIIIATSLIEIGVTIKNLRILLVIEPDRYGVNSLHQMRGRLARNGGSGTAYFLVKKNRSDVSEKTLKRLENLVAINDGFALAEADAEQRGWGDLAEDSDIQTGNVITLFKNILIPQETLSAIQLFFDDKMLALQKSV